MKRVKKKFFEEFALPAGIGSMRKGCVRFMVLLFLVFNLIFQGACSLLSGDEDKIFFAGEGTPGLSVSPDTLVSLSENGDALGGDSSVQYQIQLRSQPAHDVKLYITANDQNRLDINTDLIKFSVSDWNNPEYITVSAIDNNLIEGDFNITLSLTSESDDEDFDAIQKDLEINIIDDDVAGIYFTSSTDIVLNEDGSDSSQISFRLASQPLSPVTVPLYPDSIMESQVELSIDGVNFSSYSSSAPLNITFDSSNYDQSVTIYLRADAASDDTVTDGEQGGLLEFGSFQTSDTAYNGKDPDDLWITINDNEIPGIVLDVSTSESSPLILVEGGVSATINVRLQSQPSVGSQVVVNFLILDSTEFRLENPLDASWDQISGLIFTDADWNTAQAIELVPKDDTELDGSQLTVMLALINNEPSVTTDYVYQTTDEDSMSQLIFVQVDDND